MTKAVTAVAFMMLAEEGRVALDDPVARYLPELADLAVYAGGEVLPFATRPAARQPRIIDLLRHTAGLTYGLQQHSPVDTCYWAAGLHNFKAVVTEAGMLRDLAALPLVDDPGTAFTYSIATDLLGIITARLANRSLGAVFAERIFGPLGMADSFFRVPPDKLDRLTDSWAMHPVLGRRIYDAAEDSIWARLQSFESGGGGLVSSIADYHRFCRMMLGQGGGLLKPETVALMTRNHLPGGGSIGALSRSLFSGPAHLHTGHGLGLAVTLPGGNGVPPAGEFHWSGQFSTWFSVVPDAQLILIFMTQLIPAPEYSYKPDVLQLLFA
jgi:CubicO group peptidase (beta-lactamase class C family)